MSEESNHNESLIKFIAQTVEGMRDQMATMRDQMTIMGSQMAMMGSQMATKDDLAQLRMATKDDLAQLRSEMATKDDLAQLRREMATKAELAQLRSEMATKDDLARMESRLDNKIDAGLAAVRGDIDRVAIRVENLDSSVSLRFTAVEAAVSRVRSVVYLLAKDQPDLVRLLGPEPARS